MPSATPSELDALYESNPDPWNFRCSSYEHRKYDHTLAMLPRARYRNALEVGASIGILGRRLAKRSDRYLGVDASRAAIDIARQDLLPGMAYRFCVVPGSFPEGPFDLVVLSEVLYFLSPIDVEGLAMEVKIAVPDGDIVCVNYLGPTDRELDGQSAMRLFANAFGAKPRLAIATADYRIDVFSQTSVPTHVSDRSHAKVHADAG